MDDLLETIGFFFQKLGGLVCSEVSGSHCFSPLIYPSRVLVAVASPIGWKSRAQHNCTSSTDVQHVVGATKFRIYSRRITYTCFAMLRNSCLQSDRDITPQTVLRSPGGSLPELWLFFISQSVLGSKPPMHEERMPNGAEDQRGTSRPGQITQENEIGACT
jgi:hypothetical protein